ncbi:ATP-dependent zinc metalloprotease FtsH [Kiritimatiellaeota bacterium B1221]|nr:ATP-dependent zinc metalloprotease FtsH [Kiritimatiellaeota bacterium B1221]
MSTETPPPSSPSPKKPAQKPGSPQAPKMPAKNFAAVMIFILLFLMLMHLLGMSNKPVEEITYKPEFLSYVNEGLVLNVTVFDNGAGLDELLVQLDRTNENNEPETYRVPVALSENVLDFLEENVPGYSFKQKNTFLRDILVTIGPFIFVMILIYFLFLRQMKSAGKGAMSFGKSRAKMLTRDTNKITFKDVAGIDEAKEEVEEIIEFLSDPKKFQKLGGRIPKGVMLSGPPGTGKTLLAKAIAGEADVPFFSISGSDFVEMFVGVGASRVRDMFEQGRKNAPCILFIDEIDAVGRSRFSGMGGGHDEREQTLNALLVEMDGFDTQEGVIIVAATNRPDVLDNALMRPGRFDRQIMVDLPSLDGREQVLKIHTKTIKLDADVDLRVVAKGTPGFSGADLANLVNEAALTAARRGGQTVQGEDFEEARDKVRFGRERRGLMMDDEENLATAYHEAGHAIVMQELEHAEPVHKVTIIPRGNSLGSTMQLPEKDAYTHGKKKLQAMLVSFMGGRAAEELALDDIGTGASNDIERATQIARAMVCKFGMNDELGPQAFGNNEETMWMGREVSRTQSFSEETARKIDAEVTKILKFSHEEALRILTEKRAELDTMAHILISQETIDGRDVKDIVDFNRIRTPEERGDVPAVSTAVEEAPAKDASPADPVVESSSENPDSEVKNEEPSNEGDAGSAKDPSASA